MVSGAPEFADAATTTTTTTAAANTDSSGDHSLHSLTGVGTITGLSSEEDDSCGGGDGGGGLMRVRMMADTSRLMDTAAVAAGIDDSLLVDLDDSEHQYLLQSSAEPPTPVYEDTKLKPRHPCAVCRQCFALRSTWYEHMRQAHSITKPFTCDECPKRYSMLGALNYHRLTTHRGVVHACKTCGKRFMTKPGLVRHAKSHFGGVYLCEDCSKTFPTRDSLRRHRQQVHMGEKPHVCQYCQEKFGASHSLKRHIKRRHSSRPTVSSNSSSANSALSSMANSSALSAVTSNNNNSGGGGSSAPLSPHTCTVCHKGFVSLEALRKHVQSMHQHARYQCETCLRRFSDWSNLNRHRRATKSCMPVISVDESTPAHSSSAAGATGDLDSVPLTATSSAAAASVTPIVIQHLTLEPSGQLQLQTTELQEDSDCQSACHLVPVITTSPSVTAPPPPSASLMTQSVLTPLGCVDSELVAANVCADADAACAAAADGFLHELHEPVVAAAVPSTDQLASVVSGLDHCVELQPVNALELQALEPSPSADSCLEQAVLVPVTLATAGGDCFHGQQDVYVTLYPAGGDGSGHRFICLQSDGGAVLTELPITVTEQVMDVN